MSAPPPGSRRLRRSAILLASAFVLAAVIGLGPGWWERHLYRQTEALTGVGSKVQPGTLTDARRKVDPGRSSQQIVAALGDPSFSQSSLGSSRHDLWAYYYADGTMTLTLTDGIAQRISMAYGPPFIPTSRRPL